MARIAGVNLPTHKRLEIGLTYIYGIGRSTAQKVVRVLDSIPTRRCVTSPTRSRSSTNYIDSELEVEGDLRRERAQAIKRLAEIGSYRGIRHRRGLPVRGQRTKTNGRTRKGGKPRRPREEGEVVAPPRGSATRAARGAGSSIAIGQAHIKTSFNNTIVALTDQEGNVIV